jgi:hypothetical protein
MASQDSGFFLLLGTVFVLYGLVGIFRRKITIGIGSGHSGGAGSLLNVRFTGSWAISFGSVVVVSGVLIALPALVSLLSSNSQMNNMYFTLAIMGGLALLTLGFIFCAVMQAAIKMGSDIRKEK